MLLTSVVFSLGIATGVAGEPWLRATAGFILRTIVPPPVTPLPAADEGDRADEAPLFAAVDSRTGPRAA